MEKTICESGRRQGHMIVSFQVAADGYVCPCLAGISADHLFLSILLAGFGLFCGCRLKHFIKLVDMFSGACRHHMKPMRSSGVMASQPHQSWG